MAVFSVNSYVLVHHLLWFCLHPIFLPFKIREMLLPSMFSNSWNHLFTYLWCYFTCLNLSGCFTYTLSYSKEIGREGGKQEGGGRERESWHVSPGENKLPIIMTSINCRNQLEFTAVIDKLIVFSFLGKIR